MTARLDLSGTVNIEAEQAVLGAVLIQNSVLDSIAWLEAEHFSEPLHQEIYAAAKSMVAKGRQASPITIKQYLTAEQELPGGMTVAQYLAHLAAEALTMDVAGVALGIIDSHARRRGAQGLEDLAERLAHMNAADNVGDTVGAIEDLAAELRAMAPTAGERESFSEVLDAFIDRLGERRDKGAASVPLPLPELQTVLQEPGFQAGNLYGLLGASGEGKTSLVLQILRHAAECGHPTLLISFDQSREQVVRQMISQATGISVGQMAFYDKDAPSPTLSQAEVAEIVAERDRMHHMPISIRKVSRAKTGDIVSLAKQWVKWARKRQPPEGQAWGCPLVILDHNRKVTPDDPRAHEGRIAGAVNGAGKALAEELGAAVLFLNQRNSQGASRYVPRPIAADLFGGEQAKEDYDAILYVYRPERWRDEQLSIAKDEKAAGEIYQRFKLRRSFKDEPRDPEGMAELGTIKVRYGSVGLKEFVRFEGRRTRYVSERAQEREAELF